MEQNLIPAATTTTAVNHPSTLNDRLTVVNEQLIPASGDAIAAGVLRLHRAGMAYPPGLDQHRAGDVYRYALKGLAIEGLKRALEKLIQGQIPNVNRDFIPTPPSLAAIVRIECAALWAERDRVRTAIESMKPVEKPAPSEEQRQRVRALVQQVKDSAEAYRRETMPDRDEIEAEFAEKYRGLINRPAVRREMPAEIDDVDQQRDFEGWDDDYRP